MKHLFTFLLIVSSVACFAQGNLQFNKVLNFDYPSVFVSASGTVLLETINVPIGKVWKITAASSFKANSTSNSAYKSSLAVNSHFLWYNQGNEAAMNTPFWLSSGVHEFKVINEYSAGLTFSSAISVIEFNIVP